MWDSLMTGLSASCTAACSAPSSETTLKPWASTTCSGVPSPLSTNATVCLASLSLSLPSAIRRSTSATACGVMSSSSRATEILQETRHWDEASQATAGGRVKSDADDYRYFPDPDLVIAGALDRLRHDLDERHTRAVVVDERMVGALDAAVGAAHMRVLAGVVLDVRALDRYTEHGAVLKLHVQIAFAVRRLVVLRDLVIARHVRVEVVLARELAPLVDLAVQRKTELDPIWSSLKTPWLDGLNK